MCLRKQVMGCEGCRNNFGQDICEEEINNEDEE